MQLCTRPASETRLCRLLQSFYAPASPSPSPSGEANAAGTSPPPSGGSGGGSSVQVWVWAVVGVCAGLAIVAGARGRRRGRQPLCTAPNHPCLPTAIGVLATLPAIRPTHVPACRLPSPAAAFIGFVLVKRKRLAGGAAPAPRPEKRPSRSSSQAQPPPGTQPLEDEDFAPLGHGSSAMENGAAPAVAVAAAAAAAGGAAAVSREVRQPVGSALQILGERTWKRPMGRASHLHMLPRVTLHLRRPTSSHAGRAPSDPAPGTHPRASCGGPCGACCGCRA